LHTSDEALLLRTGIYAFFTSRLAGERPREDKMRRKDTPGFAFSCSIDGQTARFGLFVVAIERQKAPGE
jgi:hypothetical protein